MFPGTEHHLFSTYTPENEGQLSNYPVEFLNNFNIPSLPDHELTFWKEHCHYNLNTVYKTWWISKKIRLIFLNKLFILFLLKARWLEKVGVVIQSRLLAHPSCAFTKKCIDLMVKSACVIKQNWIRMLRLDSREYGSYSLIINNKN